MPAARKCIIALFVVVLSVVIASGIKFNFISEAQSDGEIAAVPTITASMSDSLISDGDGDGRVDTGDLLEYNVTLINGGTEALGVKFTNQLSAVLTLIPGTVNASPLAYNDPFTASGNIRRAVPAASGLLVNDIDPDTNTNSGLTASGPTTTAQGGNLTITSDGGFTYTPAAGFEGADSFTYTVTDSSGATGTGTATISVSGMIWFVNGAAPAGGDGRLTSPFNCLVGAGCFSGSANDPNDNIFVYSGAYTGGLTLKNGQRIIGQGASASLSVITGITPPVGSVILPSTGGVNPTVTTILPAASAFTLASNNTIRGLTIGNTTASDIAGTGFGTFTLSEVTLNGTGRALDLNNGVLAATFQSITSTSSPGQGIALQAVTGSLSSTGGTTISSSMTQGILVTGSAANINFGNTVVAAGTDGVSLQNNAAGTRTFGTLSITNGSGVGFLHANGGGSTSAGTTTITNPGGRGIDIQNAVAANAVSFAAANVTQSGGTGVHLQSNAGAVTFGDLDITPDSPQRAFFASANTGLITTTDGAINSPNAVAVEINGTNAATRTPLAMVLTSVSTTDALSGIVLNATSGSFAVNGTGTTAGSGGTIQNITNRGASFIDANAITLRNLNFTNVGTVNGADPTLAASACGSLEFGLGGNLGCNAGIHLVNVVGATFSGLNMNGGVQQGINGNNVTSFTLQNSSVVNFGDQVRENGIQFRDLRGTAVQPSSITGATVTGNEASQLLVVGTSGTLAALNIMGGSFGSSTVPNGVDGITVQGTNIANMTVNVQNAAMSGNAADGFSSSAGANSIVDVTVNGSTINGNRNAGVNLNTINAAIQNFDITNNNINGQAVQIGSFINVNLGAPSTGTMQGTVSNNTIVGSTAVGAVGAGIRTFSSGTGTLTTLINGNNISGLVGGSGIDVHARNGSSAINTTIRGNTVALTPANTNIGIFVQSGLTAGPPPDNSAVCTDIGGGVAGDRNSVNAPNAASNSIRVRQQFSTVMTLPGFGGPNGNIANIQTFLAGKNTIVAGSVIASTQAPGTIQGGPACTQPSLSERLAARIGGPAFDLGRTETYFAPMAGQASEFFALNDHVVRVADAVTASGQIANTEAVANDASSAESAISLRSMFNAFVEVAHKLTSAVSPTVHSQETPEKQIKPASDEKKIAAEDEQVVPEVSELVCIDGDAAPDTCVGGGFTLPASRTITLRFRALVGSSSPALTQVSTQGTVSGSNFASVLTDDPDAPGVSDPTVTIVDSTTLTVASSVNPSMFGQNVTFTATMSGAPVRTGNPAGSVLFKANGVNIGASVNVVPGAPNVSTAQITISTLSVGNNVITADYTGGGGFNSNFGTLAGGQVVLGLNDSTTAVVSSANPIIFGQPVTFTATVSPASGSGTPAGTASFFNGGIPIAGCQNVALQAAQAQCQPASLGAGSHVISATYNGSPGFNPSTGNLTGNPQVVNKANTSLALVSSQDPAPQGTAITFTASVSVTAPGAGTRTGSVQFLDGGNPIAGCTSATLNNAVAICTTTSLLPGNHTITAQYSGDANFNGSVGSLVGNPQVITGPPVVTTASALSRVAGVAAINSTIAFVSDDVAAPGSIVVTAASVPAGLTVTNIVNINGIISANIGAACGATVGNNPIVLRATDGKGLAQNANLDLNVLANPVPTLGNYANVNVVASCKLSIIPDNRPADNLPLTSVSVSSETFTGTLTIDPPSGIVTATASGGLIGNHTATVTAIDSCGAQVVKTFGINIVTAPTTPTEFDFDGDRKADVAVYRPGATSGAQSVWFVLRSSTFTAQEIPFGIGEDKMAPGDYDGNGTAGVGVFRPSTNIWYTSTDPATGYGAFQWGLAGDIPVAAKYDADSKTDIAVFRPSNGVWYIANSTGGFDFRTWGSSGDKPAPGDYDGDGLSDAAVFRPSTGVWYVQKTTGGNMIGNWGISEDIPAAADYDGDGKDDIAVFRPSTGFWYVFGSMGPSIITKWGQTGDIPVAADYDNDGKADFAVFRPSTGQWFIFNSCPCMFSATPFGVATDRPVQSAFAQ